MEDRHVIPIPPEVQAQVQAGINVAITAPAPVCCR
jgi:hypothetical protein